MQELSGLRVCHLASGDLWAGAEVQIASLLGALSRYSDLRISAVVLNEGRLLDELRSIGISVTLLDESRKGSFDIVKSLRSHFQQVRPDIVHTHRYKEHILGVLAARLSGIPTVIQTYHGLEENLRGVAALKMTVYDWLNTIVTNVLAHGAIGVSEDIAARLRRRFPGLHVRCIRNGLDLGRLASTVDPTQLRQELGIPPNAFVVGSVGRLTPVKGVEYLIKAFSLLMLNGKGQANRLIIVGDGPLRAPLERMAQEQGVAAQTIFLGERRDVHDLVRAFDLFALPSLHEGIPMVLLEAMAIGVPVVASRVGGIPEVVTEGKEALLVPPQDPEAIVKALESLRNSSQLRQEMIEAARHRVESLFLIGKTAGLVRDMYRELSVAG